MVILGLQLWSNISYNRRHEMTIVGILSAVDSVELKVSIGTVKYGKVDTNFRPLGALS